jgi:hypothetical protein
VLADAQVKVPAAEIDGGVPVVHGNPLGWIWRRDFPRRALDKYPEPDVIPVLVEAQVDEVEQTLFVGG